MENLINIGFVEAGEWLKTNNKSGIDYILRKFNTETKILYAFISESKVYYIGKTDNSLHTRMNGYKNANGTQTTNIRVQAELKKLLQDQKAVQIYVLVDNFKIMHFGVEIRLAAGLEDNLIGQVKPEWNYRSNGKTRIKEQEVELVVQEEAIVESNLPLMIDESKIYSFEISTNEVKNGRINFPKKQIAYDLLPDFNTVVTVFIGKEGGTYFEANLIDSGSGNARITKSVLRHWYEEENLENQQTFKLDIINKTMFRIYK